MRGTFQKAFLCESFVFDYKKVYDVLSESCNQLWFKTRNLCCAVVKSNKTEKFVKDIERALSDDP